MNAPQHTFFTPAQQQTPFIMESPIAAAVTTTTATTKSNRRVQFSTVDVYEMGIIVGDHPSTSQGPPVTIEWIPQRRSSWDLDQVEEVRKLQRRSSKADLRLSCFERTRLLLQTGCSSQDLLEAATGAIKIQRQRQETLQVLKKERNLRRKLRQQAKALSSMSSNSNTTTSKRLVTKYNLFRREASIIIPQQ